MARKLLTPTLVAAALAFSGAVATDSSKATVPDTSKAAAPDNSKDVGVDTSGAIADFTGAVRSSSDQPGVGRVPAFVCLHTTLTDQGHTRQTNVIRKSGNPQADLAATRVMRRMKIQDQKGVPHIEREINVLVKIYATGAFAFRFFELYEPLPEICSAPPWQRGQ
ncbi:MAG: hypothetical protein U1E00_08835 [Pseudoxanthomonas sp.]|nr:hypothetical protein [Pseudoxanthomonas sp.]